MRHAGEFTAVMRGGVRARRGCVVVHHLSSRPLDSTAAADPALPAPIFGLVVGKAVGGSVVRHRVSRQLRAQLASRLDRFPAGSATVVRALPEAAEAGSARIGADLEAAFGRLFAGARR